MKDQKLLVPLDRSPISSRTVEGLIAMKAELGASLTLLHVLDLELLAGQGFPEQSRSEFTRRAQQEAEQFVAEKQQYFADAGIKVTPLIREGHARDLICALADGGDYDLLVIGRNPVSELRDLLFGQVGSYVVHHVACPVLIL